MGTNSPHAIFSSNAAHLETVYTSFVYFCFSRCCGKVRKIVYATNLGTFCSVMMPEMGDSVLYLLSDAGCMRLSAHGSH